MRAFAWRVNAYQHNVTKSVLVSLVHTKLWFAQHVPVSHSICLSKLFQRLRALLQIYQVTDSDLAYSETSHCHDIYKASMSRHEIKIYSTKICCQSIRYRTPDEMIQADTCWVISALTGAQKDALNRRRHIYPTHPHHN